MASNASEQLNVLVRLSSDQAAVQRVTRDIQGVKQETLALASGFEKLGPVAAAGVALIESKFGLLDERVAGVRQELQGFEVDVNNTGTVGESRFHQLASEIDVSTAALEELRQEALATADAVETIPSPKVNTQVSLSQLGSLVSQTASATGNSEIGRAAGLLGQLGNAAATANPAFIALTAAGIGVTGVIGAVTAEYQRQIEVGTDLAKRDIQRADLVASGATSTEVQGMVERLDTAYSALAQQANDELIGLTEIQQLQHDQTAGYATRITEILDQLGYSNNLPGLQAYADAINAQLDQLSTSANDLREGIDAGLFAYNDATVRIQVAIDKAAELETVNAQKAEEKQAQAEATAAAWEDIQQQWLDQELAAFDADRQRLDFARQIDQMTADQRAEYAANLREQQSDLEAVLTAFRGTGWEGLPEAEANLTQVNEQLEMLGVVSNSTADRLEAARIAQEQYNSLYDTVFDAISDTADAQARAAQAQQNYNEAVADSDARFGQLTEEILAKTKKLEVDTQKAISTAQSDAAEKRIEIEQDLGDKLAEVRRNYARSELNAVRDRNADALEQAQVQRDDQENSATKAASKQQDTLEKALTKQVQTTRDRLDEQLRVQRDAWDRQIAQLADSTNREKATKQRALDQANVDLFNAKQIESALNRQFYSNEYTMRAQANAIAAVQAYEGGRYAGAQWAAGALAGVSGSQYSVNTFPPLNAIPTASSGNVTAVFNIGGGSSSGQQLTAGQQAQVIGLVRSITAD